MPKRPAVVVALLLGTATPALAIPAFARRYEVACHFCHDGFPKLNLMGQRFKERGFRMERDEAFAIGEWARSIPADVRASGTRFFLKGAKDGWQGRLEPISAGSLGERVSYWVDWELRARSEALTPAGEDNVAVQEVENAWARLDIARGGRLYLRGGRLEMEVPFTQLRTPHLFAYEIYFANTGFESDRLGDYQDGLELGGSLTDDLRWSAALVKGRDSELVEDNGVERTQRFEANLFLRLARRSGRDRYGVFSYIGRNHLVDPTLGLGPWQDDLLRLGVDASVWVDRLNLYGVAMYGRNSNSIATPAQPAGTGQALDFTGGFVQADWHLRDQLALTGRLNVVSQPPGPRAIVNETLISFYPGLKLFIREGRAKLSFEYGFRNQGRPNHGALQAELAF